MQDFALTFESEAAAIQALSEYRVTPEDGEQWTGSIIPNATRWVQRPVYDEDGNVITPAETVPGYHSIIRAESIPEAAQPFIVAEPGDIEPVFAGGWKHPVVPESVTRLQARLALIDAGLWDAVTAYFQDPSRTAVDLAFWEDAQVWMRNDPVIASAAPVLGLTEAQIDQLFITAARL